MTLSNPSSYTDFYLSSVYYIFTFFLQFLFPMHSHLITSYIQSETYETKLKYQITDIPFRYFYNHNLHSFQQVKTFQLKIPKA